MLFQKWNLPNNGPFPSRSYRSQTSKIIRRGNLGSTGWILCDDCRAFLVTMAFAGFLMNGEYKRKETVIGYLAPSNGLSVIRADQGGRLVLVFVNEGDYVEAGIPLFESA